VPERDARAQGRAKEVAKKEYCVHRITGGLLMADKLKGLLEADSQPVPTKLAGEQRNNVFPEVDRLSGGKRRRIRFKLLNEHGLEEVLEKVSRIIRHEFSDLVAFQELTSCISELALDTDREKIGDAFAKDNLFIIPIIDKENKVVGRSVFAFVRRGQKKRVSERVEQNVESD